MKSYNLYEIDSFTTKKFTGNPAGVVTNADGLKEEDMQKIAREMNNSETTFKLSTLAQKCGKALEYSVTEKVESRSDHASFDEVRIPSILFEYQTDENYHTDKDTLDKNLVATCNLVSSLCCYINDNMQDFRK